MKATPNARTTGGDITPVAGPSARSAPLVGGRDVFDADTGVEPQELVVPPGFALSADSLTTGTLGKGKGRMVSQGLRQPSPLRTLDVSDTIDLSSPPFPRRSSGSRDTDADGEGSEGGDSAWVDTDVGSECDEVAESATRERPYTGAARNSL